MSGLVNQITIEYGLDRDPSHARSAWKQEPPPWMAGYELTDESYNGLSYRADVTPLWQRVLFLGLGNSFYSLSVRFEPNGGSGSRVTINGQASEKVQAAIREDAAAHGGGVDPRVS